MKKSTYNGLSWAKKTGRGDYFPHKVLIRVRRACAGYLLALNVSSDSVTDNFQNNFRGSKLELQLLQTKITEANPMQFYFCGKCQFLVPVLHYQQKKRSWKMALPNHTTISDDHTFALR